MATFPASVTQSTLEKATYTIDYTADLVGGGAITAGTAVHTPPSGSGTTCTCSVVSPYVYVTVPALTLVGVHYVDVKATASDGDTPVVRLTVNVVYPTPTARASMADLIVTLRSFTMTTPNDYVIAGNPYWSDAQLQSVLDRHSVNIRREALTPLDTIGSGGVLAYYDYQSSRRWLENTIGGTSRLIIQTESYGTVGTAGYSVDAPSGRITFGTDTEGLTRYLTGYSYDMNAAAADVWTQKASHYAMSYDFSTDNHNLSRSQLIKNCMQMAKEYGAGAAMQSLTMERPDTSGLWDEDD